MHSWDWNYAIAILPKLLGAAVNALIAAGASYSVALILGLGLAVAQRTRFRAVNQLVRECVDLVRTTPLLLQIYLVFYIGPQYGAVLSPWVAGIATLGVHYGSYLSEVYRSGLDSVPRGQWEACRALNLSMTRTYVRVIIPQALPPSLPGLSNYLVAIIKDTPILSVIGVAELVQAATIAGTQTYRFVEPFTLIGLIFLAIALPMAWGLRIFENWVRRSLGLAR
jgi:polar amino acid transport system permease protein